MSIVLAIVLLAGAGLMIWLIHEYENEFGKINKKEEDEDRNQS